MFFLSLRFLKQIAIQIAAFLAAILVSSILGSQFSPPLLAAFLGTLLSLALSNPWWWHILHGLFVPLIWLALLQQFNPLYYFFAFCLTLLIFLGTLISRVPLYFSSSEQLAELNSLIGPQGIRIIDLGAGIGSAVVQLAKNPHIQRIDAYEIAPITWLFGTIRCLKLKHVHWHFSRFESADLSCCDLAYAFLSPEPMTALWEKVATEMPQGSLFVSNSFPVPDVEPTKILLADSIHPLFVYQIP